jgi:UDPglucose 6-dehydrogenase
MLIKFLEEKGSTKLAILGLSYKEDTPVIEESVAIEVIKTLTKFSVDVTLYDPAAMGNAEKELEGNQYVSFETSAYSCLKGQSVCFIATPWEEFSELRAEQVSDVMASNPIILDAWGILPFTDNSGIDVRCIGKNIRQE